MTRPTFWKRLPGYLATGLLTLTTTLWTYWSMGELYYEAWGLPFPEPLFYLIPGVSCILLSLIALTWPRLGGWLIIAIGSAFTTWRWVIQAQNAGLTLRWMLSWFPISGLLVIIGGVFILEGRLQRRREAGWTPHPNWFRRNLRYLIALGPALLIIIGLSLYWLPVLQSRQDDGDRGARLIEGNGVTLVWAPAGPGWNWQQEWGGYPSWDSLALYGVPPAGVEDKAGYEDRHATATDMATTGLCHYLSADGLTLMDEPQDIWRMPTTDELVRSLVKHGENAGCTWDGQSQEADCSVKPDKETPLWAPDQPPVYYWTADEYDTEEAYYANYAGSGISSQPKSWGNPRHGYRCVREP